MPEVNIRVSRHTYLNVSFHTRCEHSERDMKREHRYRITLEHLGTPKEGTALHPPLTFEVGNHDDLFPIIERSRAKKVFDPDTAAALALGLKLFREVMLKNRNHPLFAELDDPMRAFIRKFKALPTDQESSP